jgi:prevent-host-death family protein
MTETVNVHEAKTHLSRLLDEVRAGKEIILAKAGEPYARLVPIPPASLPERRPGRFPGVVGAAFFEPLPPAELALWDSGAIEPPAAKKTPARNKRRQPRP